MLNYALIEPDAMARVDKRAEESGISVAALMERAGQAVAASALGHYPQALSFVVLCGVGNNGGDGFVAARALKESAAEVAVYVFGDVGKLKGAAKQAFDCVGMSFTSLGEYRPIAGDVVIDAIF